MFRETDKSRDMRHTHQHRHAHRTALPYAQTHTSTDTGTKQTQTDINADTNKNAETESEKLAFKWREGNSQSSGNSCRITICGRATNDMQNGDAPALEPQMRTKASRAHTLSACSMCARRNASVLVHLLMLPCPMASADVGIHRSDPCSDATDMDQTVGPAPSKTTTLPRASLMIVGGDLAYPGPSYETYTGRFMRPFEEALPPSGTERLRCLPTNKPSRNELATYRCVSTCMRACCRSGGVSEHVHAGVVVYGHLHTSSGGVREHVPAGAVPWISACRGVGGVSVSVCVCV